MKIKLLALTLSLALCLTASNSMGQETFKGFDTKKDLPRLNKFIRRSVRRLNAIEGGVSLTSGVTGILPLANGGTGSALVDPAADRILFWDDSEGTIEFLTPGTALTITATTINAEADTDTGNIIFHYQAQVEEQGADHGEVIGTTFTPSGATGNYRFIQIDGATYVETLTAKFTKIPGIATVTVYGEIWQRATGTANLQVDIGGQTGSVAGTANRTTPEWKTFTIDVSGLTNSTVYDISVQMKHSSTDTTYLGTCIMFGS